LLEACIALIKLRTNLLIHALCIESTLHIEAVAHLPHLIGII